MLYMLYVFLVLFSLYCIFLFCFWRVRVGHLSGRVGNRYQFEAKSGGEVGKNDKRSPCGISQSGKNGIYCYIIIFLFLKSLSQNFNH